jgi:hypothetical protein
MEPRSAPERRWLVLFHHVPSKPDYLRVKVGRQLRSLGAVALKNAVYVLPATPQHRRSLERVARDVIERGGEAVACEAEFVVGLSDHAVEDRFREARDAEYGEIVEAAKRLASALRGRKTTRRMPRAAREFETLKRQFTGIVGRDPFGAGGRETAAGLLSLVEDLLQGVEQASGSGVALTQRPRGATWVTRAGVMVDRIASAWLIRRFIDPSARLKFVSGHGYRPRPGEFRFDMANAEFTHEGERCTFEVLLERFRLRDSALRCVGEIVHDLDLEDERYQRPETSGLGRMIVGIALGTPDDTARITRGTTVLDGLYQSFRRPSG